MDYEEKKRHQLVRVIIAEVGMVLAVIAIAVVAIMAAMGFFIADGGKIEQSGLMQIHSMPTGATVELDGATLFARTNLSRTMAAGAHHLKMSRAGYDTWENDIQMYSGVLIRLYYPRLFLQGRTVEQVMRLTGDELEFYTVSQSRDYILYAEKGAADWHLLDMRGDTVRETTLDLSGVLPGMVEEMDESAQKPRMGEAIGLLPGYRFEGEIKQIRWSLSDEKVLVLVKSGEKEEWVLVNLRSVENSLNLTSEFGLKFERIEMIDNAANQLFVLEGHHLRKISASDGSISKILIDRVEDFANYGSSVLYVADDAEKGRVIATYRDGEGGGTAIAEVDAEESVKMALMRYYDEDYICYTLGSKMHILYGLVPNYREEKADLSGLKTLVDGLELEIAPERMIGRMNSGYVLMQTDKKIAIVDLDMGETHNYTVEKPDFGWIDAHMFYAVENGKIRVWDYDGANMRDLSESRRGEEDDLVALDLPVMITSNDRYLCYLVKTDDGIELVRERIRD